MNRQIKEEEFLDQHGLPDLDSEMPLESSPEDDPGMWAIIKSILDYVFKNARGELTTQIKKKRSSQ